MYIKMMVQVNIVIIKVEKIGYKKVSWLIEFDGIKGARYPWIALENLEYSEVRIT